MKYIAMFLLILGMIVGCIYTNPHPTANDKFNELVVIQEAI